MTQVYKALVTGSSLFLILLFLIAVRLRKLGGVLGGQYVGGRVVGCELDTAGSG